MPDDNGIRWTDPTGVSSRPAEPLAAEPLAVAELPVPPSARPPKPPPIDLEPAPTTGARIVRTIGSGLEWLFGAATLIAGLALIASAPVMQFLTLGYMLEASARVARSGRLTDALIGVRKAARIGGLVAGAWLMYLPVRGLNDAWFAAQLIDPESGVTAAWRTAQIVFTGLMVVHILLAWYSGGRLRDYLWPFAAPWHLFRSLFFGKPWASWFPPARIAIDIQRGGVWQRTRDAVWDFAASLRLPHYFWLGLQGFVGALLWLALPALLMAASAGLPPGPGGLCALLGMAALTLVILYVPFLQTHLAIEGRFSAIFERRRVRELFVRAPLAFWIALTATLVLALPLFLAIIEYAPREILLIPSLLFVLLVFPARVLLGWAVGRARRRPEPASWLVCWPFRLASVAIAGAYVGILYLTQFLAWNGAGSLFEQHAFLTPPLLRLFQ